MKIGIFDSGIGGLIIMKHITEQLPEYDYLYLGDTKHIPYGEKSPEAIYLYTEQATKWLFEQGCELIIVACNTASAGALRKIQQCFLPGQFNDRRILGMVIPTVESVDPAPNQKIGILATEATVRSEIYLKEFKKILPDAAVFQVAAPKLVPLIESGKLEEAEKLAVEYTKPLIEKGVQTIILGCTHFGLLETALSHDLPSNVNLVSQGEFIPQKLLKYLENHPEKETTLSKNSSREFFVTKITPEIETRAKTWFGHKIDLKEVSL